MNNLEKEFVPYQESLELKKLGFNEPCFRYIYMEDTENNYYEIIPSKAENYNKYNLYISVPTFSQAFRYLRKKYNIYGIVIPTVTMNWTFKTMSVVEEMIEIPPYKNVSGEDFTTYEEAELACLKKLIEIVKNKE